MSMSNTIIWKERENPVIQIECGSYVVMSRHGSDEEFLYQVVRTTKQAPPLYTLVDIVDGKPWTCHKPLADLALHLTNRTTCTFKLFRGEITIEVG